LDYGGESLDIEVRDQGPVPSPRSEQSRSDPPRSEQSRSDPRRYDPWWSDQRRAADDAAGIWQSDHGRTAPETSTGYGLIGMQQRVAMLGGELTAGSEDERGFRVAAHLPVAGGAR
jgi:hypothetical protein